MKKLLLLNLALITIFLAGYERTNAQLVDVLGARLMVDEPLSIAGVKAFTYSSNPDMTGPWGRALDSSWSHVEIVRAANDSTACTDLDANAMKDKWVLIYRGGCEFGFKALKAQQAGAKGVVIWNHTPNELTNMAAGASGGSVTIPVLFITNEDGRAITNHLSGGNKVYISLTTWGFGLNNDLAMVPASQALPPAGAMPIYHFDNSDVPAYRVYTGGYVANTGTKNQTMVRLAQEVKWTPAGGSASVVFADSTSIDTTFAPIDSIIQLFSAKEYKLAPTGVGRYDFSYAVLSDSTDERPTDNTVQASMEVTTNAFCKGRFNAATQEPIATTYIGLSDATLELSFGPLFFNHTGNYKFESVGFSVSDRDTSAHTLDNINNDIVDVYLFKWVDANSDGLMQSSELTLKSIAVKTFTEKDSNGTHLTAQFGNETTGAPADVISESDSWYWVAVNLSSVFRLGCDGSLSYYNRANAAQNFATNKSNDWWAPAYTGNVPDLRDATGDLVRLMPFNVTAENSNNTDSAAFSQQIGTVPALALYTSVFPAKVPDVAETANDMMVYPNPANENVSVKIDLKNQAEKAYLKVIDAFGRNVHMEQLNNVKQTEVSIATASYPAGNYYAVIIIGDKAMSRPFTISR